MKNSNKIYKILVFFAIVCLLLAAFCTWMILIIQEKSEDLISTKNSIATLAVQASEINDFKNNYQAYRPNFEKIDQLFIDPNNFVNFIEFLESATSSAGVVSKISLQPSYSDNKPKNYIIFQISSTGAFSKISDFLKQIETGSYLVEVENLTVQNSSDQQNQTDPKKKVPADYSARKVDAQFVIKAYTK